MTSARTRAAAGTRVLIGDVGGTHARLALHDLGRATPVASTDGDSRGHRSFDDIAAPFVEASDRRPAIAVLGIAGPVRDGAATVTNLPWRLEERALEKRLHIRKVILVNDLVVAARGCLGLREDSIVRLTPERPASKGQHLGVLAAGTGLGEARLIWDGHRHLPLATEGSHCDFAPRSDLEMDLWRFLHARHPNHVSYERVVSGDGIGALYDFFAARSGRETKAAKGRLARGDKNAAVTELGLSRASRPAALAVDLFASLYGAEAGNLVLRELAVGGIFAVGNIAQQILPARRDAFLEGFRRKGRFGPMLREVPVAIVTHPAVGLRGALAMAGEAAAAHSK